jgi:hypothetical protein
METWFDRILPRIKVLQLKSYFLLACFEENRTFLIKPIFKIVQSTPNHINSSIKPLYLLIFNYLLYVYLHMCPHTCIQFLDTSLLGLHILVLGDFTCQSLGHMPVSDTHTQVQATWVFLCFVLGSNSSKHAFYISMKQITMMNSEKQRLMLKSWSTEKNRN